MNERIIQLGQINPVEIFGVNDKFLNLFIAHYPQLKIIGRGNKVKAIGTRADLDAFEEKFNLLMVSLENFGKISEVDIEQLLNDNEASQAFGEEPEDNGVLVHGRNGRLIKALTKNQQRLVNSSRKHDLVFAIGPAGTGKTYTAVALAVRALKNKSVKRIVLTRPAVEAGENLGFLPGDLRDKLDPYLQPLYDALRDMLPTEKLLKYLEDGTVEVAPMAFMRGRTLDHAFVILDEAQNATEQQLKMFVTRMGRNARFIVTGDVTQIDLPRKQGSGLLQAEKLLKGIPGIDFIYLDEKDVVRHKLVTRIISAYAKDLENNKNI